MADIHSLKTSISEMSDENAIQLLLDIREARRDAMIAARSKKKSTGKKKVKKKESVKDRLVTLMGSMTQEQIEQLKQQLEE